MQRVAHLGAQRVAGAQAAGPDAERLARLEHRVPQRGGVAPTAAPARSRARRCSRCGRPPARCPASRPPRRTCSRARAAARARRAPRRCAGPAPRARRAARAGRRPRRPRAPPPAAGARPRRCWPRWGSGRPRRRTGSRRSGRRPRRRSRRRSTACTAPGPGPIRPRSLVRQALRKSAAPGPRTTALPRCDTSKSADRLADRGVLAHDATTRRGTRSASTSRRSRPSWRPARRGGRAPGTSAEPASDVGSLIRRTLASPALPLRTTDTRPAAPRSGTAPVSTVSLSSSKPTSLKVDALVVGVAKDADAKGGPASRWRPAPRRSTRRSRVGWPRRSPPSARPARRTRSPRSPRSARCRRRSSSPSASGRPQPRGLGPTAGATYAHEVLRRAAGAAARALAGTGSGRPRAARRGRDRGRGGRRGRAAGRVLLPPLPGGHLGGAAQGAGREVHAGDRLAAGPRASRRPSTRAATVVDAVHLARDWVNTPPGRPAAGRVRRRWRPPPPRRPA